MKGPCVVVAEFYSPDGGDRLHRLLDGVATNFGYELLRTGDRPLAAKSEAARINELEAEVAALRASAMNQERKP